MTLKQVTRPSKKSDPAKKSAPAGGELCNRQFRRVSSDSTRFKSPLMPASSCGTSCFLRERRFVSMGLAWLFQRLRMMGSVRFFGNSLQKSERNPEVSNGIGGDGRDKIRERSWKVDFRS